MRRWLMKKIAPIGPETPEERRARLNREFDAYYAEREAQRLREEKEALRRGEVPEPALP